ncbi:rhamnogalacturonan acetylesterase [Opitutaceae bacterium TAV4]|nr:rhamnogalacturonan acetylesterase [Opitutaceae bacterium TAV4]RRK00010.1 rhamnogalacturonan acetylesterase [Opitutaceae bacterium TAV3]
MITSTSLYRIGYPLLCLLTFTAASTATHAVTVSGAVAPLKLALIGDSTVCDYKPTSPMRGWGQLLHEFLPKDTQITNAARGGLSTKTFPPDRWQGVLAAKPDYVLIQFGHNDSHAKDKPESTAAATDYRDNLRRFVREARVAGVTPILVTPVHRRLYKNGHPTNELGRYADAMKAVATELDVKLIDLHATSGTLFDRLGEDGTESYTVNKLDNADRPGLGDRTHFTETGAREIARLVAVGLTEIEPRIATDEIRPPR